MFADPSSRAICKAWVCGRSPTEIVDSNHAEGMDVCCECCVLLGRGLCDELITRPEESYRLCCVVVCDLTNLKIEESIALVGPQIHKKKRALNHVLNCWSVVLNLPLRAELPLCPNEGLVLVPQPHEQKKKAIMCKVSRCYLLVLRLSKNISLNTKLIYGMFFLLPSRMLQSVRRHSAVVLTVTINDM
jgi:hypothetical protein